MDETAIAGTLWMLAVGIVLIAAVLIASRRDVHDQDFNLTTRVLKHTPVPVRHAHRVARHRRF